MRADLRASQVAPGAVLELEGRSFQVVGSLHFDMRGALWAEHCIKGEHGRPEWLSIRPRGELTVVHWVARPELEGEPGGAVLEMDGRTWSRIESGTARYSAEGHTGTGRSGSCEFVEYADGDSRLVYESFDGGVWEISVGRLVDRALVHCYREVAGA
ncbi:DUF4178 domain-containing protein [Terrabacter sp. NPDC080008]|uniref:DUF4178 domain-containing protein n=1 Tax=Terrabacter sp. NPDC080008 TaxID=3155176 RepID=UPI00344FCD2F